MNNEVIKADFNEVKQAVTDLLRNDSNKFFLTLSPKGGVSRRFMIESLNQLIHLLNQDLYGKRYKKKGVSIEGVVVLGKVRLSPPT